MNDDEMIRGKMDALDALSGGIVFGRAGAWEKLEGRMDKNSAKTAASPFKTIPLPYWAAAAVLLLCTGLLATHYYPAHEIAKNAAAPPANNIGKDQPKMQPETARAFAAQSVKVAGKPKPDAAKNKVAAINVVAVAALPVVPAAPVALDVAVPVPRPAIKKMAVIHINELGIAGAAPDTDGRPAGNDATVDVRKLPLLHINDVMHEETEVKRILQENRLGFGHLPFWGPRHGFGDDAWQQPGADNGYYQKIE